MKYMLLIYGNQEAWNDLETNGRDALDAAHRELLGDLTDSGELILSNELSTTDAKVVRRTDDELLVTDGPFTESKEMIGRVLHRRSRERRPRGRDRREVRGDHVLAGRGPCPDALTSDQAILSERIVNPVEIEQDDPSARLPDQCFTVQRIVSPAQPPAWSGGSAGE